MQALVPYIDLLTCMVAFLLITAVWSQLARMDVTQKGQGAAGSTPDDPNTPPPVQLTLFVDEHGYTFTKSTGETTQIDLEGQEYNYVKLAEVLTKAKTDHPDKTDINIKADDKVIYNKIIRTMDVVVSAKFPDVGLSDKGAQ